jgi:hypothetical protein
MRTVESRHLRARPPAEGRPQGRQGPQEAPLQPQPLGRDGLGLRVGPAVHLGTPVPGPLVGLGEGGEAPGGDHQVPLGVAHQVLHEPLGLGVGGLAEVGPESVVSSEPDVVGVGDDHVGHLPGPQAGHPVREDHRRDPACLLEALREEAQGGLPALVGGEADEPPTAPGQHRAEDPQGPLFPPVDDEVLARRVNPGPVGPLLAPPGGLGLGNGPAEVPGRAGVAGGLGLGQEPLGRDPASRVADPAGDEVRHDVGVLGPGAARGDLLPPRPALQDAADGLVGRAADLSGGPVAPRGQIGVDDVHALPRRLQLDLLPGAARCGSHRHHRASGGRSPLTHRSGWGLLVATGGDIYMATDTALDRRKNSRSPRSHGHRLQMARRAAAGESTVGSDDTCRGRL